MTKRKADVLGWVIGWFRHEPGLKLVSLLIALFLWSWRSSEGNPLEERRIAGLPVKVINLDPKLHVASDPPRVDVVLYGPRRTLERLAEGRELQPIVDCAAYDRPSWPSLKIQVPTPENVELRTVEPAEWEVEIDTFATDEKPVRVDVGNTSPPEGYIYEPPQVTPKVATVKGPRRRVNRVSSLAADIDLSERRVDYIGLARLRPVDSAGQRVDGVECDPRVVSVTVRVSKVEETRALRVVVPIDNRAAQGFRFVGFTADPAQVTVRGTAKGLEQLGEVVYTTPVDIGGRKKDVVVDARLTLPRGVVADRQTIRATVRIAPTTGD